MRYLQRIIQEKIRQVLKKDKSILLLGPRQTGKTTVLEKEIDASLNYSFLLPELRQRFELNPTLLIDEIKGWKHIHATSGLMTVLIDEIQKVPTIMDVVQYAVDKKLAKFVITGSSARKLKKDSGNINLLPGRVIELHLDALSLLEMPKEEIPALEELLINGSLPEIFLETASDFKEELLTSYVRAYLEEEIRAEAIVRNLTSFSKFLVYAAIDAGKLVNLSNISKEIGVSRHMISEYYQILEDCLIVTKIEPITKGTGRRRLTKSPKYLFFDLGIRRVAAGEGVRLPQKYYGDLFEQFVGIELLKIIRLYAMQVKLRFWRDHSGPEVDFVIDYNRRYIPIEVKWSENPSSSDAKHLHSFMTEYDCLKPAYIICRTPRPIEVHENVIAIPWQDLGTIFRDILKNA